MTPYNNIATQEHARAAHLRGSMLADGIYPYSASPAGRYTLTRDGQYVMSGTEGDVWSHLHRIHAASVGHLLRFEGYTINPA